MESVIADFENITAEDFYHISQKEYFIERLNSLPVELSIDLFSKWAEENRYIPEGISDYYGNFDPAFTPHLIEILDRLHPDDPCSVVTVLKSVQSLVTTTVGENLIGAVIRYGLGSILYLTSTKTIGKIRGSANIDSMIDNSNIADYVSPISNRTNRKSTDNALYKEFKVGNQLMVTSYNSIADMKSNPFKYIIKDEYDEAGAEIKDQGDISGILDGRTFAVIDSKTLEISTASRAETSRIWKSFLMGDQRHYHCPCPICGEKQKLVLKRKGQNYGLTFTTEIDKLSGKKRMIPETVRYTCKFCEKDFYEHKKMWMLQNGLWVPEAIASDPSRHSYQIPGLISPALGWNKICQKFIDTEFGGDLLKFKDFTINVLGRPWAAVKKSVKWEILKSRAENYTMGEVPAGEVRKIDGYDIYHGPILFYGGVDVQGDRLELCVTGFGYNGEKWIVDYQIFYGNPENIYDECWDSLDDFVRQHSYSVLGKDVYIGRCAIDSGYDPRKAKRRDKDFNDKAHIVYEFVSTRQDLFVAVMGTPDEKAMGIVKEARISDQKTTLQKRYMVSVSLLKDIIMSVIEQSFGFNTIHVPMFQVIEGKKELVPDEFFQQFLSEVYREDHKNRGKFGWFKVRSRNEVLDTFIYSIAASALDNISTWSNERWSLYYFEVLAA